VKYLKKAEGKHQISNSKFLFQICSFDQVVIQNSQYKVK